MYFNVHSFSVNPFSFLNFFSEKKKQYVQISIKHYVMTDDNFLLSRKLCETEDLLVKRASCKHSHDECLPNGSREPGASYTFKRGNVSYNCSIIQRMGTLSSTDQFPHDFPSLSRLMLKNVSICSSHNYVGSVCMIHFFYCLQCSFTHFERKRLMWRAHFLSIQWR